MTTIISVKGGTLDRFSGKFDRVDGEGLDHAIPGLEFAEPSTLLAFADLDAGSLVSGGGRTEFGASGGGAVIIVSSGVTSSGNVVGSGEILEVEAGGTTVSAVIESGGAEADHGTALSGRIESGGLQIVESGGSAMVESGASASDLIVSGGRQPFLEGGLGKIEMLYQAAINMDFYGSSASFTSSSGGGALVLVGDGVSATISLFGQYVAGGFHLSNTNEYDTVITYSATASTTLIPGGH